MSPAEIGLLQAFLRRVLGAPNVGVRAKGRDAAELVAGEDAVVAEITRDDDEGEVSYTVSMGLPRASGASRNAQLDGPERMRLQEMLRMRLGAPKLDVRPRPRKTDSAEIYVGEEFIGTLSVDDAPGQIGAYFTMSILDIDLEESA